MEKLTALYAEHIKTLQNRTQQVLQRSKLDAILIHSGEPLRIFLDDSDYPFKVNPHFKAWVPVTDVPHSWLLVDGINKPKLWFYSPVDYWHSVEPLPNSFWTKDIELIHLKNADDIKTLLASLSKENVAYIGSATARAESLGISLHNINPKSVLDYYHYHRSYKTDYELYCMREAQKMAVNGHLAALEAFRAGMSEFDINVSYLQSTGHRDTNVPYGNIVALNENAAVLHYTKLQQTVPNELRSFLIDAGAEYNGYAADITRTYAAKGKDEFAELVADVNTEQLALIDTIKAGVRYTDYHVDMHHRIAKILIKNDIVKGISEESMVESGLTTPFLPHGLGHPLGLQVHDAAGFMQDDSGTHLAAPKMYPFLRCTRVLEPKMVLTIEPGLYFIESLLSEWRNGEFSQHFNWDKIEFFKPYGGIRIEDNIVIHANRIENMTRDLHLR
ncbi:MULTISPECIES: Xaa-Pro dipeptidase [Providencia]|uniref:Xaa-Pro dipeptidase n=1 Tax=Providencia rettgeri TaxID=587 RepID=A0A379FM21_PRORE|nr:MULTISPECIES: Xaa-Pro dipeptidase [Providencia]EJD6378522.1 Xaa-Pro dipeptidase [Providencia rettgeri]EJF7710848.1 Xaa-Pro dipeptidase [Providencia rettgeri]EKT53182.1 proline dipeptidase [Providencia rettgeri Dmel1]ELR5119202.1 Xaa-Pro dipeptidase [Providencia rettgeri]MBI6204105.1 Xaa-Pro dipeptidase [Providencia rettgeri]